MSKEYGNDSITQLKGADRLRLRPEALLGSNGLDGSKHTVIELVGNATDEKLAGYGDKLELALYEDGSISVRDYGRGVPLGWNEKEQNWNYFLIYEELYAGGKYDNNQEILREIDKKNGWSSFRMEDYPYLITIGLNGLGAAASQYTSEHFEVISYRKDGWVDKETNLGKCTASRMYYEKGKHVLDELEVFDTDEPSGTFIKWKPDSEVFRDVNIPAKWLDNLAKSLSYVAGFNTIFNNKGKLVEYKAKTLEEEMLTSVENCISANNFVHIVDEVGDICICQADVVIGSSGRGSEYFHNRVEVKGGVHASSFNTALWIFFNEISSEEGIKIKEADYAGKFSIISSTLSNKMSLRGQTKDSLDDVYILNCLKDCIYNAIKTEYQKGTEWIVNIVEEVLVNARNRLAVQEMSKNLKEIEKTTKKYKASDKFVSCSAYQEGRSNEVEYFIVEGDSAGGKVKYARDSIFQCYLAIRGKSLNVYKASIAQLIANREIKDMIASLGCGIDLGIDGYESFNIDKLKVGKIFFLSDADIDGDHIKMLLFLIFYKLFPELLYQGYVYVIDTPLYVINLKNSEEAVYCMSNDELQEKREEIGVQNIRSIDRFKGLGEMHDDDLWNTTLDPQKRHIRQIKIDRNDMALADVLEVLFGKSTERRKKAILGSMIDGFEDVMDEMTSLSEYIDKMGLNESLEVEEIAM